MLHYGHYLIQGVSFVGLYGYHHFYPTRTAARHVRSLRHSASDGVKPQAPTAQIPQSFLSTVFPTHGFGIWLVPMLSQSVAEFCLGSYLPYLALKYVTIPLSTPFTLLWIQSIVYDQPTSPKLWITSLRSVALKEWMHFIATVLAFDLLNDAAVYSAVCIFMAMTADVQAYEDLGTYKPSLPAALATGVILTMIHEVLMIPAKVAAVQAVPDPDEKASNISTWEFWMKVKRSLKTMPLSLWLRMVAYRCIGGGIFWVSHLLDTSVEVSVGRNVSEQLIE